MSRGRHARDGQRRDALHAWLRGQTPSGLRHPVASVQYWWRWCQETAIRRRYRKALKVLMRLMTPAPEVHREQEARPVDHPLEPGLARGVVRAGADALPAPAPRHAAGAGQAQTAGATLAAAGDALDELGGLFPPTPAALSPRQPDAADAARPPTAEAAPLPRPEHPAFPGPGQHSFSGRSPWTPVPPCPPGDTVTWHRPDGTRVVIGWGPKAEIPRPYAQARVTGAHVIIPGEAPLVSRRYRAHEARRDRAANQ